VKFSELQRTFVKFENICAAFCFCYKSVHCVSWYLLQLHLLI